MPLLPGGHFWTNYSEALGSGVNVPVWKMLLNSMVMALGITIGKIIISLLSAFAIVYFNFRFKMFFFWMIFLTLMLPVEVRIVPTYQVIADFGMGIGTAISRGGLLAVSILSAAISRA